MVQYNSISDSFYGKNIKTENIVPASYSMLNPPFTILLVSSFGYNLSQSKFITDVCDFDDSHYRSQVSWNVFTQARCFIGRNISGLSIPNNSGSPDIAETLLKVTRHSLYIFRCHWILWFSYSHIFFN